MDEFVSFRRQQWRWREGPKHRVAWFKSEAGSYYGFTVAISVVLGLPMDVELHAHTELKLRHRQIQICIVCL